jgi:2-dehydropantoate 2-reductase
MQNGFARTNFHQLRALIRLSDALPAGCYHAFSSGTRNTSTGDFILVTPKGSLTNSLKQFAEALSVIDPAHTTDNIMGHLYSKLIINSLHYLTGAICGLYLGKMLGSGRSGIFLLRLSGRLLSSDRMGIRIEVFGGN